VLRIQDGAFVSSTKRPMLHHIIRARKNTTRTTRRMIGSRVECFKHAQVVMNKHRAMDIELPRFRFSGRSDGVLTDETSPLTSVFRRRNRSEKKRGESKRRTVRVHSHTLAQAFVHIFRSVLFGRLCVTHGGRLTAIGKSYRLRNDNASRSQKSSAWRLSLPATGSARISGLTQRAESP
jgi:hypothetical protein